MKLSDGEIYNRLKNGNLEISTTDIDFHSNKDIKDIVDDSKQLQPASVDLKLEGELRVYNDIDFIDVQSMPEPDDVRRGDEIILKQGEFALASTRETVRIPNDLSAEVKGRSSVGRAGFHIHTAGWVDPGFEGQITLELVNHAPAPVKLHKDMRICQIVFDTLDSSVVSGYGDKPDAKYQNQSGPTASRLNQDFEEE